MNILFLISLFVLFPLGEVTRYQFDNGVALSLFDIVAGFNTLFLVFWIITYKKIPFTLTKPILLFILACIVSLLFQITTLSFVSLGVASLYLVRFIVYMSFYPTVSLLSKKLTAKLPVFYCIAGSMVAIFGIIQFFLYPNLVNLYYLGWDEHWYRLFATFFDPNFAGTVLLFPFFFAIFLTYQSVKKYDNLSGIAYACVSLFLFVSIFLTFSRSALLALIAGLITFVLTSKANKWIKLSLFGAVIVGIIITSINYKATEGTKLYRFASSNARIQSIQVAWTIFSKNPLVGVGFNAYRYAQYRYGFGNDTNWTVSHSNAGTDNSLLFILATTGIIGFSSFTYLIYCVIKMLKQTKNNYRVPIVSFFVALSLASFFINALFYPAVMFLLWSSLGFIENKKS